MLIGNWLTFCDDAVPAALSAYICTPGDECALEERRTRAEGDFSRIYYHAESLTNCSAWALLERIG